MGVLTLLRTLFLKLVPHPYKLSFTPIGRLQHFYLTLTNLQYLCIFCTRRFPFLNVDATTYSYVNVCSQVKWFSIFSELIIMIFFFSASHIVHLTLLFRFLHYGQCCLNTTELLLGFDHVHKALYLTILKLL